MIFPAEFASQFAVGAMAGIGQSFGHRLIPWVVRSWKWLAGTRAESSGVLVQEVSLPVILKSGIPAGQKLCLREQDTCREVTANDVAGGLEPGATLWLYPSGDLWQPIRFAASNVVGQAEVGVELLPEDGLHSHLESGSSLDRHWLSAFVQGTFAGIINSLASNVRTDFLQGDASAIAVCSEKLDQALRQNGVRCRGIRGLQTQLETSPGSDASAGPREAELKELATELSEVKTRQDWDRLVDGLKAAGVPIDAPTSEKLASIQNEVLERQLPPAEGVRRLAELTADAFARAGIEEPDLRNWQKISRTLGEMPAEESETPPSPASVSVAVSARPATWFVWSRDEVDRRQLMFTRRTVRNCRTACEQGLLHLRELPALRDLRGLNEQLGLIEDLLTTVPPLTPARAAMRVDKQVAKDLVAAYADAVTTTSQLALNMDTLLKATPTGPDWNSAVRACREATAKLAQMVRDRRAIR